MWPLLAHQKPGSALDVLVVPVVEPGSGCGGERASRLAQALVPGSSEPSGQSQLLSLSWAALSLISGWRMHWKPSLAS